MNTDTLQIKAIAGMDRWLEEVEHIAKQLKMGFAIKERYDANVDVNINGFIFTLMWEEEEGEWGEMGIRYDLCTWYTDPGNRWNPPEQVDVNLGSSGQVYSLVEVVFLTIYKEQIRGIREAWGEEKMRQDEELLEKM